MKCHNCHSRNCQAEADKFLCFDCGAKTSFVDPADNVGPAPKGLTTTESIHLSAGANDG